MRILTQTLSGNYDKDCYACTLAGDNGVVADTPAAATSTTMTCMCSDNPTARLDISKQILLFHQERSFTDKMVVIKMTVLPIIRGPFWVAGELVVYATGKALPGINARMLTIL